MKNVCYLALFLVVITSYAPAPLVSPDIQASQSLALKMFNRLNSGNTENFVFSSYSIRNCFAYVYPGASGNTKNEMQNVLGFSTSAEDQLKTFKASNDTLRLCKESKVQIANSMWIRGNYPLKPEYKNLVQKYTDAVQPLTSAAKVNDWVNTKTNGLIKELVKDGEISDVKVLLVNCLALDALWKYPFNKESTKNLPFYNGDKTLSVPTMTAEMPVNYYQDAQLEIVQLPYRDQLKMTILMPARGLGFDVIAKKWDERMIHRLVGTSDMFDELNLWTSRENVYLFLPKFKMETTHDLIPMFSSLGINDAFSSGDANFNNMNSMLYIGLVKQKAMIEVTEAGTKAAAASAIGAVERSLPETIKFDRPFAFIIHHGKTGEILFMGKLGNPLK